MTEQAAIMFHEHTHNDYDTIDLFYDCLPNSPDWSENATTYNYEGVRLNHLSRVTDQCEDNGVSYSVKLGRHGGFPPLGAPGGCTSYWSEHAWFCEENDEHQNADTWEAVWYVAFVTELQTLYGGYDWMTRSINEAHYVNEEWLIANGRDVYDEITCSWTYMTGPERNRSDNEVSFFETEFASLRYYEATYGPDHHDCDGVGALYDDIADAAFDYLITDVALTQLAPGSTALQRWLDEHDAALMSAIML